MFSIPSPHRFCFPSDWYHFVYSLSSQKSTFLPPSIDTPEDAAKVRILRARVRKGLRALFGVHEDLHAALTAEPDNPDAKALLPQRSVNVEKVVVVKPLSYKDTI
ncbi:hypothetical protein K435DRAFT_863945 [Dendrothele bispora CBS 962.96]|uniref:Uncharacterized protein n=1 Tax=Dendrothele bispora (strain CBS 962.96) TaxID=1314807 RepID=A0A4S8LP23_DENBC|nr:hypothetical protein K435DRAFT_863945 [Dendrothele bispora CBS 962.96]